MTEYRVSFDDTEDGMAQITLYKNDGSPELLHYDIEKLPEGATPGDQFRPEFNESGEIVELHYNQEMTERKREDFKEAVSEYKEMLEDN